MQNFSRWLPRKGTTSGFCFMYRGYIRIWRKIEDNPLSKDPYFMALWSWILILSNHQEKEWKIGYQKIPIKSGQFATSRKSLSLKTGIHESKIERILKYLESEQQIEQQKTTKYRLITVLNWTTYQNVEQQSEQQVNNKWTASEQQVNTTKECIITNKNDKNVKKGSTPYLFKFKDGTIGREKYGVWKDEYSDAKLEGHYLGELKEAGYKI